MLMLDDSSHIDLEQLCLCIACTDKGNELDKIDEV
jgi:hypothetical protein